MKKVRNLVVNINNKDKNSCDDKMVKDEICISCYDMIERKQENKERKMKNIAVE